MKRLFHIKPIALGGLLGCWSWLDGTSKLASFALEISSGIGYGLPLFTILLVVLAYRASLGGKYGNWARNDFWLIFRWLSPKLRNSFSVIFGLATVAAIATATAPEPGTAIKLIGLSSAILSVIAWYQFCLCNIAGSKWLKRAA